MKGEKGEPGPQCVLDADTRANLTAEIKKELLKCAFRSSCKELYECDPKLPSDYYEIWTPKGVKRVYCEMNGTNCSGDAGWMRVVKIDTMTADYNCSAGKLTYDPVRVCDDNRCLPVPACALSEPEMQGCSSVTFQTHGVPYTKVCGRAEGYQIGNVSAFYSYKHREQDLESAYVSGLSVTRGEEGKRKHIWTFAAGYSKNPSGNASLNCPCAIHKGPVPPKFVGENYFCETGNLDERQESDDPLDILWDSRSCPPESSCCVRDGPWFNTAVNKKGEIENKTVSDDIEVRLCQPFENENENIRLNELEIYIY